VYLWGSNSEGQLGLGDFSQRNLPVPLPYFQSPVSQVQAGAYHTVFLDTFGVVYVCGLNSNGQLGVGEGFEAKTPNKVSSISSQNITTIASGHYHVFAIAEDGEFSAWGANSFGQLGVGDDINRFTPASVSAGLVNGEVTQFKAYSIFAGQRHSIVVTDSGDLYVRAIVVAETAARLAYSPQVRFRQQRLRDARHERSDSATGTHLSHSSSWCQRELLGEWRLSHTSLYWLFLSWIAVLGKRLLFIPRHLHLQSRLHRLSLQ
jgi:hypothetical protein